MDGCLRRRRYKRCLRRGNGGRWRTIEPTRLELLDDILCDLGDQFWWNGIRRVMLRLVERCVDGFIDRLLWRLNMAHGHAHSMPRLIGVLSRSVLLGKI